MENLEDKIEELEKEIKELELENAQLSASLGPTVAENEKLKNSLVVIGKAIDLTNDVWRMILGGVKH